MKSVNAMIVLGTLSLLPWQALAASAPAPAPAPAAGAANVPARPNAWSKIDPTGKGYISLDEWVNNAKAKFKEIDANNDGKITKEEMQAYHKKTRSQAMAKRKSRRHGRMQ